MTASTTEVPDHVSEEAPTGTQSQTYYLEIFLVSFAGLLLEISYTRVVSYKLFYYFTYLVIGLALLGLGAGGVFVAVSERLRRAATDTILMWCLLLGAPIIGVAYLITAAVPINSLAIWNYGWPTVSNGLLILLLCLVLFASFVPAGLILSTLFGRRPETIGRMYFVDLIGAGLACALVVPLVGSIGPPATIMLAGLAFAIASARVIVRTKSRIAMVAVSILAIALAGGAVFHGSLPDVKLDGGKIGALSHEKLVYSSWSPIFRVDVREDGDQRVLFHDGLVGSIMLHWDGNVASLEKFDFPHTVQSLAFSVLPGPPQNEAIIGAAAGHETVMSLYFGTGHVDSVELNPVTYRLVTKTMADYDGHLAENPRVHYVNADGRSFIARSNKKYDLIWLPAPDSYSATNASTASAFVLSESYLYTRNAIEESLKHLAPGGVLVAQFGEVDFENNPNRTARYVATARAALAKLGIKDASTRILVGTAPRTSLPGVSTIVVKKDPFTPAEINRFVTALPGSGNSSLAYAPGRSFVKSPVTKSITATGARLREFSSHYQYSVGAITDDKPFFWHFATFNNVAEHYNKPITGNVEVGVGERVLLLLLAFAVLLAAVFLLLPFVAIRSAWRRFPRKLSSAIYFSALGLGFLFFEITLIQRLILFLGYPTYSLTVTLSSLLLSVGVGALLSGRLHVNTTAIPWLGGTLAVLGAFYLFGLTPLTQSLLHLPLAARVPIAFLLLVPLGMCLGMFMPVGLGAIAALTDSPKEYVAWGWAVNGFASVIGSVLATILAMTYGFQVVLVAALVIYAIALVALRVLLRDVAAISA